MGVGAGRFHCVVEAAKRSPAGNISVNSGAVKGLESPRTSSFEDPLMNS